MAQWDDRYVDRGGDLVLIPSGVQHITRTIRREPLLVKARPRTVKQPALANSFKIKCHVIPEDVESDHPAIKDRPILVLDHIHCLPHATYFPDVETIRLKTYQNGAHAAVFLKPDFRKGHEGPTFAIVIGSDAEGVGGL